MWVRDKSIPKCEVYVRRVDPSALAFSLSSHRYSYKVFYFALALSLKNPPPPPSNTTPTEQKVILVPVTLVRRCRHHIYILISYSLHFSVSRPHLPNFRIKFAFHFVLVDLSHCFTVPYPVRSASYIHTRENSKKGLFVHTPLSTTLSISHFHKSKSFSFRFLQY